MNTWEKLAQGLSRNDTAVAGGHLYLKKPDDFYSPDSAILVRSGEQGYRLLVKDWKTTITLRGLCATPYIYQFRIATYYYAQFLTDVGIVYFSPAELNPGSPERKRLWGINSFEGFMEFMKGIGGLQLVGLCPFCGRIRPAAIPECSNPECAPKAETESVIKRLHLIFTAIGVVFATLLLVPGLRSAFVEIFPFLAGSEESRAGYLTLPTFAFFACEYLGIIVSILYKSIRRKSTG